MAVGHSDPNEMSSRIDAIAEGISQTEQTIRELQNITGMGEQDGAPSILGTDLDPAARRRGDERRNGRRRPKTLAGGR